MPTLRARRLLNAVEAGTVSGAQLETYLADAGRLAEFSALINNRGQMKRIVAGPQTITSILASNTATECIRKSPGAAVELLRHETSKSAIQSSSTALVTLLQSVPFTDELFSGGFIDTVTNSSSLRGQVVGSTASVTTLIARSDGRSSFWGSDLWLASLAGSATAKAVLRSCPQYSLGSFSTAYATVTTLSNTMPTAAILVGWSTTGTGTYTVTMTGRRAGSTVGTLTIADSSIVGTTAQYDNIVAFNASPTFQVDVTTSLVHYLGRIFV